MTDEMLAKLISEEDDIIVSMLPDPKECKAEFSPEFEKKMQKLIEKTDNPPDYSGLKRAACILLSFVLSAVLLFGANNHAEASILDWMKEQVSEVYHYFFVREDEPEEMKTYYLGWVPDGYTLMDIFDDPNGKTYIYINESGSVLQFLYRYGSQSNAVFFGSGEYKQKSVSMQGLKAEIYLATNPNESNAITKKERDGALLTIIGFVKEKELVKMAKNIAFQE